MLSLFTRAHACFPKEATVMALVINTMQIRSTLPPRPHSNSRTAFGVVNKRRMMFLYALGEQHSTDSRRLLLVGCKNEICMPMGTLHQFQETAFGLVNKRRTICMHIWKQLHVHPWSTLLKGWFSFLPQDVKTPFRMSGGISSDRGHHCWERGALEPLSADTLKSVDTSPLKSGHFF